MLFAEFSLDRKLPRGSPAVRREEIVKGCPDMFVEVIMICSGEVDDDHQSRQHEGNYVEGKSGWISAARQDLERTSLATEY